MCLQSCFEGGEIPMTTLSHLGAVGVAVGGASGSSNERALAHRRIRLEWQDAVYVPCVHLVEFT